MRRKKIFMISLGLSAFVLVGVFAGLPFSYGQDESPRERMQRTTGTVNEIDWVGGKIVVDTDDGYLDEAVFLVPDNAVLTRGTETISLNDIDQGDQVDIEYTGSDGSLKIVRLNDKNMANAE